MKNLQARTVFIEWYFSTKHDVIQQMKEELINIGSSEWTFNDLLDICGDIPKDIEQALKYSDYLDGEMRSHQADMEAQDSEVFGDNKI